MHNLECSVLVFWMNGRSCVEYCTYSVNFSKASSICKYVNAMTC